MTATSAHTRQETLLKPCHSKGWIFHSCPKQQGRVTDLRSTVVLFPPDDKRKGILLRSMMICVVYQLTPCKNHAASRLNNLKVDCDDMLQWEDSTPRIFGANFHMCKH